MKLIMITAAVCLALTAPAFAQYDCSPYGTGCVPAQSQPYRIDSHLPEQQNTRWKEKLLNPRKRLMVGPADLTFVIAAWLQGTDYSHIFVSLPAAQRSRRGISVTQWMAGNPAAKTWADEYDKFLDFCLVVLERFLPWLLQACHHLAAHAGARAALIDWPSTKTLVTDRIGTPTEPSVIQQS
jgi:hypothetical protein